MLFIFIRGLYFFLIVGRLEISRWLELSNLHLCQVILKLIWRMGLWKVQLGNLCLLLRHSLVWPYCSGFLKTHIYQSALQHNHHDSWIWLKPNSEDWKNDFNDEQLLILISTETHHINFLNTFPYFLLEESHLLNPLWTKIRRQNVLLFDFLRLTIDL